MKNASNILLLLSGIFGIVSAAIFIIYSIIMMSGGSLGFLSLFEEMITQTSGTGMGGGEGIDPQAVEDALSLVSIFVGVVGIF